MAKTDCGRIWVSEFRKYAKEKGWTDPYALVFPPLFSTVMLVSFFWRNGFDGSARDWAAVIIVWPFGVVLTWFLFIVCMPKKWRDMGL